MAIPEFRKVLVVDDDALVRGITRAALTHASYEVFEACDGQEALEYIRSDCPHFVITDWDMPRMNGLELCRQIRRESLPHYVYCLVCTSRSNSESFVGAIRGGADDFVTKPIVPEELYARLLAGTRVLSLENRLRALARIDTVTGVLNKDTWNYVFEREWDRCARRDSLLVCMAFELIDANDSTWIAPAREQDSLMQGLAGHLEESNRSPDYLGRYGMSTFVMLLPDCSAEGCVTFSNRLVAKLEALPIKSQGRQLSLAVGFASTATEYMFCEEMTDASLRAMERAKLKLRESAARGEFVLSAAIAANDYSTMSI